jgi:hypothetical protein
LRLTLSRFPAGYLRREGDYLTFDADLLKRDTKRIDGCDTVGRLHYLLLDALSLLSHMAHAKFNPRDHTDKQVHRPSQDRV